MLASLTVESEQGQGEPDILASRVCELEVDAETVDAELGIFVQAVQSFNERIRAGRIRADTA